MFSGLNFGGSNEIMQPSKSTTFESGGGMFGNMVLSGAQNNSPHVSGIQ